MSDCPKHGYTFFKCSICNKERLNNMAKRIAELEAQLAAVTEALTPSAETKARYWGGDDLPMMNWNDIKLLMKIIRERASLSQEGEG